MPEQQDADKARRRKRANIIGCAILVAIGLAVGVFAIWSMGQPSRNAEHLGFSSSEAAKAIRATAGR